MKTNKFIGKPILIRKTFRKNSNIFWDVKSLNSYLEFKLGLHMDGVAQELTLLFRENEKQLPRNSNLFCGGIYGGWKCCPNDLADKVEALIKRRHEDFEAQNYSY